MSSYYLGTGTFGKDWILIPSIFVILALVAVPQYKQLKAIVALHHHIDEAALQIEEALQKRAPLPSVILPVEHTLRFELLSDGRIEIQTSDDLGDLSDQLLSLQVQPHADGVVWRCSESIRQDLLEHAKCYSEPE